MPALKRQAAAPRQARLRVRPFQGTIQELKRVTWPSRREALHLTALVLTVALAVGIILASADYLFSRIVKVLLLR